MKIASIPMSNEKDAASWVGLLIEAIRNYGFSTEDHQLDAAFPAKCDILHLYLSLDTKSYHHVLGTFSRVISLLKMVLLAKISGKILLLSVKDVMSADSYPKNLSFKFFSWFIARCNGFIFYDARDLTNFIRAFGMSKPYMMALYRHLETKKDYCPRALGQTFAEFIPYARDGGCDEWYYSSN